MTYITAEAAQQIEEAFISVCDAFLNDDSHGLYDDAKEALATIREARAQEHSHPDELEDRPVDVELAQYKRMFEAACSSLAAIGDALGVEPEEGGAEPILSAIAELKNSPVQQAEQEPVGEVDIHMDFLRINWKDGRHPPKGTKLYTSPTAADREKNT